MEKTITIKITESDFEVISDLDSPADVNLWLDLAKAEVISELRGGKS